MGGTSRLSAPIRQGHPTIKPAVCSAAPWPSSTRSWVRQRIDRDRATLLIRLVLTYVIHQDLRWREPVAVPCSCGTHPRETLHLYPSEWLARASSATGSAAGPMGKGRSGAQPASRETLNDLIDWPAALADNLQVQFLARLGFDVLDLTIQRQAGGSEASALQLRQQVADLVAAVGPEAKEYANLIAAARERCADRNRAPERDPGAPCPEAGRPGPPRGGVDRVVVRHRGRDLKRTWISISGRWTWGCFPSR